MSWLEKLLPPRIQRSDASTRRSVPEGLWVKCPSCEAVLYRTDLESNQQVCPKCDHHMRIRARDRLDALLDNEGRYEIGQEVLPVDTLKFKDSKKYPTTFILAPSAQQEARVIASFIKDEFPNLGFNATVPNDDLGLEVKSAWESIGFSVSKYTSTSLPDGPIPKVDEKTGGILFTSRIKNSSDRFQSSSPLIARSEAVSSINRLIDIPKANWANTYAGLYLPLPSDTNDEFIIFFNKIFSTYIPGQIIDAKTIEGANAAYVFAQALTAVGPQITRQKLIDFLRAKGNTLSHAGYTPLNFGADLTANKATLYFAKFDGVTWSRYSRSYSTELYSSLVSRESPIRSRLLPNGLPVANTNSNPATTTISCVKGKLVKSVTAIKPVCPAGYKKK